MTFPMLLVPPHADAARPVKPVEHRRRTQFGQKFARSGTAAWQAGQFICIG